MDNLGTHHGSIPSDLPPSRRLTNIQDLLRSLGRESTRSGVLRSYANTFNTLLPGSCLYLWLWDTAKRKVCQVLSHRPLEEGHADIPALITDISPVGSLLKNTDEPDGTLQVIEIAAVPELACPCATHLAYLRIQTGDDSPLLLTICLPSLTPADDSFRQFVTVLAQYAFQASERLRFKSRQEVLAIISNLANQCRSREDFLRQVVHTIRDAFGAGGCTILLRDRSGERLVLGGTTGLVNPRTGARLEQVEYRKGEGCSGWIWEHRCTVRMFDARDEREWLIIDPGGSFKVLTESAEKCEADLESPRPFLGAPIFLGPPNDDGQEVLGVIRLHKKLHRAAFLPYDEELLAVICNVLAPAIERWNITAEMERELALQHGLFDIVGAIHSLDDPSADTILETIATQALELFEGYACTVLLKEPGEDRLRVIKDVGSHPRMDMEVLLEYGQGLCGYAALHRHTIAVPDVHHIPEDAPYKYFEVLPEVKSEICTSIQLGDESFGVLNVDSDQAGYFRPEDARTVRMLETFAKQAAIALHRMRILREQRLWRQNLVHTTQMLTASSVASGLAHELKNGLAAISATAQNLEPDPAMRMRKENRERLERIRKVSTDLSELALRLMDLSRVGVPHKQPVYLNEVIRERLQLLEELVQQKDLRLVMDFDSELSRPPQGIGHCLHLDGRQIQQVLTNLVFNAVDASYRGKRIRVSTRNEDSEWAVLSVQDYGTGITPENRRRLFEMFFTTKPNGFGVGLRVVKILVEENHGGRIDIQTRVDKGTTITVRLPKLKPQRRD